MPSVLLPTHLALHVLLLIVLRPEDLPIPPSSPSLSDHRFDADSGRARLSPAFASSLLYLLLRELLSPEGHALSFAELKHEIIVLADETAGSGGQTSAEGARSEGRRLIQQLRCELGRIADVEVFFEFVRMLQKNVDGYDDSERPSIPTLDRKSPLGLAVRRFVLFATELEFPSIVRSLDALGRWVDGEGLETGQTDNQPESDPRLESLTAYLRALHTGSYVEALGNLQRFFSFSLPKPPGTADESDTAKDGRPDGMHHHALLNLASFHFGHEEWEAARTTLADALRLARAASDRAALEKCMSLSRRLEAVAGSSSSGSLDVPAGVEPCAEAEPFERLCAADQLFEISHRLSCGTPLPDIQRLIYQSLGTLDREEFPPDDSRSTSNPGQMQPDSAQTTGEQNSKLPLAIRQDVETGAWASLVGGVWGAMGEDRLSRLREDALLGLSPIRQHHRGALPPAAGLGARLSAAQSRSIRMARQGAYLPALESLFDPPSIDLLQLSLAQYRSWAAAVWQVLETWAVRAGEVGAREMITTYRGSAPTVEMDLDEDDEDEGGLKRGTHASVERRLKKAQNFKAAHLPSYALPHVLGAIETAQALCLFGLYRTCTIALADVMIDLGEGAYASSLVDEVFAQILSGEDAELLAFASLTKARAILLASEGDADREPALALAASYLTRSIDRYASLSAGSDQHLLALRIAAGVAHARGRSAERDRLADEWDRSANEADARRGSGGEVEDVVRRVAQGVADLGVAINLGLR